MKTQRITPQQMDIICNIQMMQEKTKNTITFDVLAKKTFDELFELQNEVIKEYNKTFKLK